MLDAQEYLHLAIKSSQEGLHQQSLEQLHKCLEAAPQNATAIFLLAAEHAELGMHDRAIEGMEEALSIDPTIEMAQMQLGLLYATHGRDIDAKTLWEKLRDQTQEQYLQVMATGLINLSQGQVTEAIDLIQQGISLNTQNPALNDSMSNILSSLAEGAQGAEADTPEKEKNKEKVFLGAYQNNTIEN